MRKMSFAIAIGLVGAAVLSAAPAAVAQTGGALFASLCGGCHNDVNHPRGLVFNAAGNVAIIEAVNAKGMGAKGSFDDHTSVAAYLDGIKPTINMAPVPHDSPGTQINLSDIIVSAAEEHADWKIIAKIVTVTPPTKGTVFYQVANGPRTPSQVFYKPFPGQSGIDTWTYQGIGAEGNTTIRTATVKIGDGPGTPSGSPDLNQHGLTGSWYEPATSGQGLEVEVFPDLSSPGSGLTQASWFTYDTVAGGAERQRWYTLSGTVVSGQAQASLTIYQNTGGNFNAPPTTPANAVGTATLSFDSCASGQLTYTFNDGSGRTGTVPLSRLMQNTSCATTGTPPVNADFAFSGNWYDAATSGQGFTVEVNPNSSTLFFAWYTYAPNGSGAGAAGQRWYTGQGAYTPGARSIPVQLYETTGGAFDAAAPAPKTVGVGSGTLTFKSCASATLSFTFTGGSSNGASGNITLGRIGPVPPGCAL